MLCDCELKETTLKRVYIYERKKKEEDRIENLSPRRMCRVVITKEHDSSRWVIVLPKRTPCVKGITGNKERKNVAKNERGRSIGGGRGDVADRGMTGKQTRLSWPEV